MAVAEAGIDFGNGEGDFVAVSAFGDEVEGHIFSAEFLFAEGGINFFEEGVKRDAGVGGDGAGMFGGFDLFVGEGGDVLVGEGDTFSAFEVEEKGIARDGCGGRRGRGGGRRLAEGGKRQRDDYRGQEGGEAHQASFCVG